MATPLRDLLHELRHDTEVQARFHSSPGEYLHEHGWSDLDAADLQEAMLLLADAAPAAEAADWISVGTAIDADHDDPAAALDRALGTVTDRTPDALDEDPDLLDDRTAPDHDPADAIDFDDDVATTDIDGDTGADAAPASRPPEPQPDLPTTADELETDEPIADHDLGLDPGFDDPVAHDAEPTSFADDADGLQPDSEPDLDWDDPT